MVLEIRSMKRQVINLLAAYSKNNRGDYAAFMTSAHTYFQFTQPTDDNIHAEYMRLSMVHSAVDALQVHDEDDELLDDAHRILHDIMAILQDAAESTGEVLGGTLDDESLEEDGLIEAHADNFAKWTEELQQKD